MTSKKPRQRQIATNLLARQDTFDRPTNMVEIVKTLSEVTVLKARLNALERRIARLERAQNERDGPPGAYASQPRFKPDKAVGSYKPDRRPDTGATGGESYRRWRERSGF